jgi:hypothetical protein
MEYNGSRNKARTSRAKNPKTNNKTTEIKDSILNS